MKDVNPVALVTSAACAGFLLGQLLRFSHIGWVVMAVIEGICLGMAAIIILKRFNRVR
jgi:hypothetical protein